jgi:hypothetical protein
MHNLLQIQLDTKLRSNVMHDGTQVSMSEFPKLNPQFVRIQLGYGRFTKMSVAVNPNCQNAFHTASQAV